MEDISDDAFLFCESTICSLSWCRFSHNLEEINSLIIRFFAILCVVWSPMLSSYLSSFQIIFWTPHFGQFRFTSITQTKTIHYFWNITERPTLEQSFPTFRFIPIFSWTKALLRVLLLVKFTMKTCDKNVGDMNHLRVVVENYLGAYFKFLHTMMLFVVPLTSLCPRAPYSLFHN